MMHDEYEPTEVMGQTPGGRQPSNRPQEDYEPTQRMYQPQGFGSDSMSAGANKTQRIPKAPPTFAWLVVIEGIHAGHIFRLHPDTTVIGRDPGCDIVVDDNTMSRQHAKIRRMEGADDEKLFVIQDLFTENSTFVNGEEIVKHELKDDDLLLLGETKFVFKQVSL
jgi:pSer/pThr/pTyr-binding forkhead associated (FHA) protein